MKSRKKIGEQKKSAGNLREYWWKLNLNEI